MTPKQIDVAQKIYSSSDQEIKDSRVIVVAAEKARAEGLSIVVVNERFVSPPT